MDEEVEVYTHEELKHWTCESLKDFLRVRGLKVSGNKEQLISLVWNAAQQNVPVKPTEIAEDRAQSAQYAALLVVKGKKLPDPLADLKDGWIGEKEGVKQWPPVSYFEIAEWLLTEAPCVSQPSSRSTKARKPATLHRRLLSDYKEGKAYSYFDSKWVNQLQYNAIAPDSKICFVKTTCTPSQSIRNSPHTVWVALDKKSGKIYSAYCSCFAGLGSTCNHVAAVIFKLDHAFMMGESLPCTSKECSWNVYSGGAAAVFKTKPTCEMVWAKPSYHKGANKTPVNTLKKQLFNPFNNATNTPTAAGLIDAMYPSCHQGSSLFQYMLHDNPPPPIYPPEADFNLGTEMETETTDECVPPSSLSEMASGKQTVQSFIDSLPTFTNNEIATIEFETRGQADSTQWASYRSGMITASKLKSVVTRNETLHNNNTSLSKDPQPLIKTVMGYTPPDPNLPSLKYGRLLEPTARQAYTVHQKQKGHKYLEVTECGLFVHPKKVFLGATPDALVQCSCCGEGLLEIKCPRTAATQQPSESNTTFLQQSGTGTELKRNHAYYYQVQAQMAVTGRSWCDLFVYSKAGYHLERITFDEKIWLKAAVAAEQFFKDFVAPELVHRTISNL